MKVWLGIIVALLVAFQLFGRFEQYAGGPDGRTIFEHDRLTGTTREIKPDERGGNLLAQLFKGVSLPRRRGGELLQEFDASGQESHENYTLSMVADTKARPIPNEVVVASSSAPVPPEPAESGQELETKAAFSVRTIDLNLDGSAEEVIQNLTGSDGMLDISIVKNGREIFFGRGSQIALLPSRGNDGWADIQLYSGNNRKVYRYDARDAVYKLGAH